MRRDVCLRKCESLPHISESISFAVCRRFGNYTYVTCNVLSITLDYRVREMHFIRLNDVSPLAEVVKLRHLHRLALSSRLHRDGLTEFNIVGRCHWNFQQKETSLKNPFHQLATGNLDKISRHKCWLSRQPNRLSKYLQAKQSDSEPRHFCTKRPEN